MGDRPGRGRVWRSGGGRGVTARGVGVEVRRMGGKANFAIPDSPPRG